MKIQQIGNILEGEGSNSGIPMLLIRTSGCNLRCTYATGQCDQPDALDEKLGKEYDLQQLAAAVAVSKYKWVAVSGGEPLLWQAELGSLIIRFPSRNWEINTNGSIPPPSWWSSVNTWITDCKVPSSGVESKKIDKWKNIFRPQDCLKFVVGTEEDLRFVLKNRTDCCQNIVSPVSWDIRDDHGLVVISEKQVAWNRRVAEFCLEHELRYSIQVHKYIWGMERQDK